MLNLNESDKEIIKRLGYPKVVNLSIGSYLIKLDCEKTGEYELIGEKLAHLFELKCPQYYLVEINSEKYVLSADLNQYGEFLTGANLKILENEYQSVPLKDIYSLKDHPSVPNILHGNSLYDIQAYFIANYPDQVIEIMHSILKIYFFDILFLNFDRNLSNWGILKNNNKVEVIIFDNEAMFDTLSIDACTLLMNIDFRKRKPNILDDFKRFLRESSQEFIDLFKYYFDLITPEVLQNIMNEVESEHNLTINQKELIIDLYKTHRNNLIRIYDEEIKRNGDEHAR